MHVLDLVQNSLAAGASRIEIFLCEDLVNNQLVMSVTDNGRGMSPELCSAVLDPFVTSRSERQVGLGLPLLKSAAEQAGGKVQISSVVGKGTTVQADFQYDHIDRPPVGDMAGSLVSILILNETCRLIYRHVRGEQEFQFDSEDIKQVLGEVPLQYPEVAAWITQYIREREGFLEV